MSLQNSIVRSLIMISLLTIRSTKCFSFGKFGSSTRNVVLNTRSIKNVVIKLDDNRHTDVYIAMGSNIGDSAKAFNSALRHMRELVGAVKRTSFLYETSPMYVNNQDKFLNAVCHVQTHHSPLELLDILKMIEDKIGRKESFRWGPRLIDLDIILYGEEKFDSDRLQIPHVRFHERPFVLRPLCDIDPTLRHVELNKTVGELLAKIPTADLSDMRKVIPIGKKDDNTTRLLVLESKTYLQGILNVTPDRYEYWM